MKTSEAFILSVIIIIIGGIYIGKTVNETNKIKEDLFSESYVEFPHDIDILGYYEYLEIGGHIFKTRDLGVEKGFVYRGGDEVMALVDFIQEHEIDLEKEYRVEIKDIINTDGFILIKVNPGKKGKIND